MGHLYHGYVSHNQRVYPMFPDLEFVGMFSYEPWHPRHPSCSSLSNLGVQPWILPQNNQGEAQGARGSALQKARPILKYIYTKWGWNGRPPWKSGQKPDCEIELIRSLGWNENIGCKLNPPLVSMQNFRELIIYIKRCPLEMYNKLTVEEFIKNISICVYIYIYWNINQY